MAKYKKRKDGRYAAWVTTDEINPETGKRVRIQVYGRSVAELERKKAEVIEQTSKGIYVSEKNVTFGAYKWKWLELYKAGRETNTIEGYRNILKNHTAALDGLKLLQIKKTDIQTGYNALKGHADLQRRYYQTVNQIMRAAIDDGLLFKNVAENIEKDPAPKKKKRALTELERIHLEDLELDPQASTLLHMLLYTGMRRQEIIPLTRFDINFARKKITVNKAVKFVGETAVLKDTKTDSGEREIYLLDPLADVLKKNLSTLQGNLLFPGTDGSYLKKSQYRRLFERIKRTLNTACGGTHHYENGRIKFDVDMCPGLGSHTFRHEYATMLYYSGIDIMEAVEIMGHSNSKMLLDTYAELRRQEGKSIQKLNDFAKKSYQNNASDSTEKVTTI